MTICNECGQEIKATKEKCKDCNGNKIVETEKGSRACERCNGSGLEISAKNRNNRSRGHANERRLAKQLKKWWSPDGKYDFVRTPQSGGSKLKVGWKLAGDICTNAPDWPFHIECKREKGWELEQILTADKCRLKEYWDQAIIDCPKGQIPIVIMSHPDSPIQYIMYSSDILHPSIKMMKRLEYVFVSFSTLKELLSINPDTLRGLKVTP